MADLKRCRKEEETGEEKEEPNHGGGCGFWFNEDVTADAYTAVRLESVSVADHSKFQSMKIITTTPFGKTLVMDDKTQSAKFDEFCYHEGLVHPAMILHDNPKTVSRVPE